MNEAEDRNDETENALEAAFGESLDWITRTDAVNYFRHAGYPLDGS